MATNKHHKLPRQQQQQQQAVFDKHKSSILAELEDAGTTAYTDKSPKGSLDAAIVDLVREINASEDYVTTSSCSGRVSLFYEASPQEALDAGLQAPRKGQGRWLGVNHDRALTAAEVLAMLDAVPPEDRGRAVLKHEPFVLHVQCRDEQSGQALLRTAMDSGLRESGLSLGQKKIMLGIRTLANVLEVPLLVDGRKILSDEAVEAMCQVAAEKFRVNCERRAAFLSNVQRFLRNRVVDAAAPPAPMAEAAAPRATTSSSDNLQKQQQQKRRLAAEAASKRALEWKELSEGADLMHRWGHASAALPDGTGALVFGGFGPCDGTSHERRNDLVRVTRRADTYACTRLDASGQIPADRIKHAACWVEGLGSMCVAGGRQTPRKVLADVYLLDYESLAWTSPGMIGAWAPRWSHSMVAHRGSRPIIFGGRNADTVFGDVVALTFQDGQVHVESLECHASASVAPRYGHSAVLAGQEDHMVIYGGYARAGKGEESEVAPPTQHMLGDVQVLEISTRTWSTVCTHSPHTSRFSHGAVALDDDRMLVVGGVSIDYRDNGAKVLQLSTRKWSVVRSSEEYGATWAPMAMHQKFSLLKLRRGDSMDVLALGGGNLCFSFGFCFGKSSFADASWLLRHNFVLDAVAVEASKAKAAKMLLEREGLYDRTRKIVPYLHNGRASVMAVPILREAQARAQALLDKCDLDALELVHGPPPPLAAVAARPVRTGVVAANRSAEKQAKEEKKKEKKTKTKMAPSKVGSPTSAAVATSETSAVGPGVVVAASACKLCKSALEQAGLYDKSRRVGKLENGLMGVPVLGSVEEALAALATVGVDPAASSATMTLPRTPTPKQQAGAKKFRAANGNSRRAGVKEQLRVWLEGLVTRTPDLDLPPAEILRSELPKRIEVLGDVAIVPREAFRTPSAWDPIFEAGKERPQDCLWAMIASLSSANRVLLQRKIDVGVKRQSRAIMVFPRAHPDTSVTVKQNGVLYWFDMERCMFSSGNITEKQRVAKLPCRGEVVVDMFAGIGYFTLPYLVKAGAAHLHACEWNADALVALRKNLRLNGVEDRCTVYPGDCRGSVAKSLRGLADRVNLGLIPSSRPFWSTGVEALHPERGGWLHIHENVPRKELDDFVAGMLVELQTYTPTGWTVTCSHVERVKSYSPHVDHIVADVRCEPWSSATAQNDRSGAKFVPTSSETKVRDSWVLRAPTAEERGPLAEVRRPYPRSAAEAAEIEALGRPVVLFGVPSWSASFWRLDALRAYCDSHPSTGQTKVSVHVADDAQLSFVNRSFRFEVTELKALLASVDRPDTLPMYLRAVGPNPRKDRAQFWRDFAELATDSGLEHPVEFVNGDTSKVFSSVLRIASRGLQLWTHFDVMANVLYQLHGTKRMVLFRPEDVASLNMRQSVSAVVDIDGQDPESAFGKARARAMEVTLRAGEALYIPALWPHNARAEDASVAVNVFWRSLDPCFYGSKDLYGNRDPLRAERALALVQEASDLLGAAEDNGEALPPEFRLFYARIAAGKLMNDH